MHTAAIQFIHETTWHDLPQHVRNQARRCLLDTLGAGISGRATKLSRIVYEFAASAFGGQGAQLGQERTAELEDIVWRCEALHDIKKLLLLITLPV